jgi:transcriptional regulator of acetoin/glycerol metabolism
MRQFAARCHKPALTQIDDDVLTVLKSYSWPGNIRQLENAIARAVVICEGPLLTLDDLPAELFQGFPVEDKPVASPLRPPESTLRRPRAERERLEREHLVRVLAAADGNKAEAARALGVARSTLISRLKKLGLS